MSQWTHVQGIVRFDYLPKSMSPTPLGCNTKAAVEFVYLIFAKNPPTGSEWPLEVNVIDTVRGPTVVLTGDLRDFGEAPINDLKGIVDWLNECLDKIPKKTLLLLRDGIVNCEIESDIAHYDIRVCSWETKGEGKDYKLIFKLFKNNNSITFTTGGKNIKEQN